MNFNKRLYNIVEISVLISTTIFVIIIMLESSGWKIYFDLMTLWAISPYVIFFLTSLILHNRRSKLKYYISTCITSILLFLFSIFIYIDGMYFHTSSTSSLLFLFVPVYLIIGAPILLLIILALYGLIQKLTDRDVAS